MSRLDPRNEREKREKAKREAEVKPKLQPDFPYSKFKFDPFHFNVTRVVDIQPTE